MAPGPEIGSGRETPQPLAPTRIAGRCGLRGSRKGATALSRTFFVPRSPCVPAVPAFSQALPQTRLTGRDRAVWEAGGAGMPPGGERPHKRPHRGKRRGTDREGLSALPLPAYIAISGPQLCARSSPGLSASRPAVSCWDAGYHAAFSCPSSEPGTIRSFNAALNFFISTPHDD